MCARASEAQTPVKGNHGLATGTDSAPQDRAATHKARRRQGLELGETLAKTVNHFFPDLFDWLGQVRDKRDQDRITYGRRFLIWMGLTLFLLKLGSRRQLRFELDTPPALANLIALSREEQEKVAHSDTLNYFLGNVPAASLPDFGGKWSNACSA